MAGIHNDWNISQQDWEIEFNFGYWIAPLSVTKDWLEVFQSYILLFFVTLFVLKGSPVTNHNVILGPKSLFSAYIKESISQVET